MKTKHILRNLLFSGALALASVGAMADLTLREAKDQGYIGELDNGYVKAVGSPSAEVAALVAETNQKRKVKYRQIAQSNEISLANVEILAGKKSLEKTVKGNYIKVGSTAWRKK